MRAVLTIMATLRMEARALMLMVGGPHRRTCPRLCSLRSPRLRDVRLLTGRFLCLFPRRMAVVPQGAGTAMEGVGAGLRARPERMVLAERESEMRVDRVLGCVGRTSRWLVVRLKDGLWISGARIRHPSRPRLIFF
jgi:hypothetical protein